MLNCLFSVIKVSFVRLSTVISRSKASEIPFIAGNSENYIFLSATKDHSEKEITQHIWHFPLKSTITTLNFQPPSFYPELVFRFFRHSSLSNNEENVHTSFPFSVAATRFFLFVVDYLKFNFSQRKIIKNYDFGLHFSTRLRKVC